MPIQSKRYQFLDKETNVGISDFLKGDNLSTINIPGLDLKNITSTLTSFFGSTFQNGFSGVLNTLEGTVNNISDRISKGIGINLKDIKDFKISDIDKITNKVFGGNLSASSLFNKLPDGIKNTLTSRFNIGSEKFIDKKENGNIFVKALNTILPSNLSLTSPSIDRNDSLKSLVGLSSIGSDLGIKDVFKNLSTNLNLDKGLLSKAAGELSNELINKKNFSGIVDLFKTDGFNSKLSNPNIVESITKNLSIPEDISKIDLKDFGNKVLTSLSNIDTKWNKSDDGTLLNVSKISANNDFKSILDSVIKDRIPNISSLNSAPTDDNIFIRSCF